MIKEAAGKGDKESKKEALLEDKLKAADRQEICFCCWGEKKGR